MRNLREILSSINDAVWSFDVANNKFIYINKHLSDLYQTPLAEIEENNRFWLKYVHPDDYQYVFTETQDIDSCRNIEIEYRLLINDTTKWVRDKRVILFDEKNKPEVITSILSDITSKKSSDAQLSDAKKALRYLFINNPNPLWIYDKNTLRFLAVNHAAISKYGYSEKEFLAMTIADIRPEEDLPELITHVSNVTKDYSNLKRHWRHMKKNGEILYVNISGHGINYNGTDAEMIMAHDITMEVESQAKIKLAKENLDTLINNIKEDIWSIDTDYCLISANNAFRKRVRDLIGKEIIIGQSVLMDENTDDLLIRWKEYYDKALQGNSFTFTEFVSTPGKEPYIAETTMNPIKNENEIIGVACLSSNIQERLEAHNMVLEQNMKLREVISLASHEIRGPVASLLGLISTFNTDNITDPSNEEVMRLITDVTKGLDEVLHKLVDKSYSLRQPIEATKNAR